MTLWSDIARVYEGMSALGNTRGRAMRDARSRRRGMKSARLARRVEISKALFARTARLSMRWVIKMHLQRQQRFTIWALRSWRLGDWTKPNPPTSERLLRTLRSLWRIAILALCTR